MKLNTHVFPDKIRYILTSHCNFACSLPNSILYCHDEGVDDASHGDSDESYSIDREAVVWRLREALDIPKIRFGGLEPTTRADLPAVIDRFDEFETVAVSTNGSFVNTSLAELRASPVDEVNISIPSFEEDKFNEFTQSEAFGDVFDAIDRLLASEQSVKLNYDLLDGYNADELDRFIEFVRKHDTQGKINRLLWLPRFGEAHATYHADLDTILPSVAGRVHDIEVDYYHLPQTLRYHFRLIGGGSIFVDDFLPKARSPISYCQSCSYADQCQEGFMGCGIRIAEDGFGNCLLKDFDYDVETLVEMVDAIQADPDPIPASQLETLKRTVTHRLDRFDPAVSA